MGEEVSLSVKSFIVFADKHPQFDVVKLQQRLQSFRLGESQVVGGQNTPSDPLFLQLAQHRLEQLQAALGDKSHGQSEFTAAFQFPLQRQKDLFVFPGIIGQKLSRISGVQRICRLQKAVFHGLSE